jgi:hypothetical protein
MSFFTGGTFSGGGFTDYMTPHAGIDADPSVQNQGRSAFIASPFSGGGASSGSGGNTRAPVTPPPAYLPLNNTPMQTDPWSKYRAASGDNLATMAQTDPSDFYRNKLQEMSSGTFTPDDPSYKFRLEQGQQATERSLASKGLLNSGNAAIELQNYGQQAASQEYGAQFDRMLKGLSGVSTQYDTRIKQLMNMAGVGLDPTSSAKLNIESFKANTDLYGLGLQADTSRYVADVSAAASQANTQTSSAASLASAKMGAYASDLNAMANASMGAYQQRQNTQQENVLQDALFFGSGSSNNLMSFSGAA